MTSTFTRRRESTKFRPPYTDAVGFRQNDWNGFDESSLRRKSTFPKSVASMTLSIVVFHFSSQMETRWQRKNSGEEKFGEGRPLQKLITKDISERLSL